MKELIIEYFKLIGDLLKGMIDRQEVSSWQVVAFVTVPVVCVLIFWQIRSVIGFCRIFKDRKLSFYEKMLTNSHLESEDIENIKRSIINILRYRITGIKDVERQHIVNIILDKNKGVIESNFFRKFRTFLITKNGRMMFEKKWGFYLENGIYRLFVIQYLLISFLMISLSTYRGAEIDFYAHIILWIISILCIFMMYGFSIMIPTKKECELLEQVLKTQSGSEEVVIRIDIKRFFMKKPNK